MNGMILMDTGGAAKQPVEQDGLHRLVIVSQGINVTLCRAGRACELVVSSDEAKSLATDLRRASKRLSKLMVQL